MACARDGTFGTGIHSLETNNTRIDASIRQLMYSTSLFSAVPKRLVCGAMWLVGRAGVGPW